MKVVEAYARGAREMCRITEAQNSENSPGHADHGKEDEDGPNPVRSSVMLQSHESEKHWRTNRHDRMENDVDGVILLHDLMRSNEKKLSHR